MNNPSIAINVVVLNGEKYIRHCLEAVRRQSFDHARIEIHVLDNGSSDKTISIIEECLSDMTDFAHVEFIKGTHNIGMWAGQERLLENTQSPYVTFLSADVVMRPDFIQEAVKVLDTDSQIGGVQAKIYQFDVQELSSDSQLPSAAMIDTCGFQIERSRRIKNIGHGQHDDGQWDDPKDIFGVEGAVPIFRTAALESIRVLGEIADKDIFWYGEDLDVAWRMRLAGWKQVYKPSIVAWHDRGTTKGHSSGSWLNYIGRVHIRRQISLKRRRLEWRNTRWTRIKNDYIINILKDILYIVGRELEVLGYTVLFEPAVLKEFPSFVRGIPRMVKKRRAILSQAKVSPAQIRSYFS